MDSKFTPYQPVIARDSDSEEWRANFFSHYKGNEEYPYYCIAGRYSQCLPVEGNEYLIGTTDSPTPPESEFKFGDKVEVSDDEKKWYAAVLISTKEHAAGFPFLANVKGKSTPTVFKYCRLADW